MERRLRVIARALLVFAFGGMLFGVDAVRAIEAGVVNGEQVPPPPPAVEGEAQREKSTATVLLPGQSEATALSDAWVQPSAPVVADAESVEATEAVVTAPSAAQSFPYWYLAFGIAALLLLIVIAVRVLGGRRGIAMVGIPLLVVASLGLAYWLQVRPQASVLGANVTVTRGRDGSFSCTVRPSATAQVSANDDQTLAAMKGSIESTNRLLKANATLRSRSLTAANAAAWQLGQRKAQLLALAEADPAAAQATMLSDTDRVSLKQYGNCVEAPIITEGTAQTTIAESFSATGEEIADRELVTLTQSNGQELVLHAASPIGQGEQQVQGYRIDNQVVVTAATSKNGQWGSGPSPMAAVGSGRQRTLVVPVNFVGKNGQPIPLPADYTFDTFKRVFVDEIIPFYHESSNGRLTLEPTIVDEVVLSENPFNSAYPLQNVNRFGAAVVTEIVRAKKLDVRQFDKLMIFAPNAWAEVNYDPGVHWDGYGSLGDKEYAIDPDGDGSFEKIYLGTASILRAATDQVSPGRTRFVAAHEFGHALGAHHANLYACHDMRTGCVGVNRIGESQEVTSLEYGNRFGMMGNPMLYTTGQMLDDPAPLKDMRGWYTAQDVQEVRVSGEYTVRPLEGTSAQGPIALRIPRDRNDVSKGHLYVEYRKDPRITSVYPEVGQGALLNFTNDYPYHADLLVPDPSVQYKFYIHDDTFSKATLKPDDAPFGDGESGITVDVLSATEGELRVAVTLAESAIEKVPVRIIGPDAGATTTGSPQLQFKVERFGEFRIKYVVELTDAEGRVFTYDQRTHLQGWAGGYDPAGSGYGAWDTPVFTPPELPAGTYSWRVKGIVTHTTEDNAPFVVAGDFSEPWSFVVPAPESHFLLQVQAPHGPANTVVQKFVGSETVAAARAALTGAQPQRMPSGKLMKAASLLNPTWSWSWEPSSVRLLPAATSPCNADPANLELMLGKWMQAEYCPSALRVTRELGAQVPAKTHELRLTANEWKLVEVPGADMRLSAAGGSLLSSGKLLIFAFDPAKGAYSKIVNPAYVFKTGEGYMVLSRETTTLSFTGNEAYSDTLHLKQGWNLVTVPGDVKRVIASVYDGATYHTPAQAVAGRVVWKTVYTEDYSSGSYKYLPADFATFGDGTLPERSAVWVLANKEVVLQFK